MMVEPGYFFEETFVHATALEGVVHENATECYTVETPEGGFAFFGNNGGGTGGVIHECEFTKRPTRTYRSDFIAHAFCTGLDRSRGVDVDVEFAFLDDVEEIAGIALRDDFDVRGRNGLFDKCAKNGVEGFIVEVTEEEVVAD